MSSLSYLKKVSPDTLLKPSAPTFLEVVNPLTLSKKELLAYKQAKKNAFMTYHQDPVNQDKISFTAANYYAAFQAELEKHAKNTAKQYMLSAKNSVTMQVQGGLFGEYISINIPSLPKTEYATITYVFVEPHAQHQGIGTLLVQFFLEHTKSHPALLAVRHTHTIARKLYEKCGFTLITEPNNPTGQGCQAVVSLLNGPGYRPEEFVAYYKK